MTDDNLSSLSLFLQGIQPQGEIVTASPVVERRVYKNNSLNLDGYTFSNCVFVNCSLSISTGDFRLKDCHVQNCMIYYNGNALRVVRLSSLLLGNWDQLNEGLRAKVEADHGITVE